jgi:hypothetical protein
LQESWPSASYGRWALLCFDMNHTNGVVSYLFSRSDRRLGEEQPPPPPAGFESGAESMEAIPSLFSEAESQDGFGTGFHLRNPRPGLFSPTLDPKVTSLAGPVKWPTT